MTLRLQAITGRAQSSFRLINEAVLYVKINSKLIINVDGKNRVAETIAVIPLFVNVKTRPAKTHKF